jgi:hypothetical protein
VHAYLALPVESVSVLGQLGLLLGQLLSVQPQLVLFSLQAGSVLHQLAQISSVVPVVGGLGQLCMDGWMDGWIKTNANTKANTSTHLDDPGADGVECGLDDGVNGGRGVWPGTGGRACS